MNQTELESIRQMSDTPTIVLTMLLVIIAILTSMCERIFDIN
jgi:hypothetical protein